METYTEGESFWRRMQRKLEKFREDLKKDSVGSNPVKPVDCCNPPVPPETENKLKK
ncbi:MAG: hypothetical protein PVJ01_00240 [Pseudomonadota bacterium]|jgi:hypothetical protein